MPREINIDLNNPDEAIAALGRYLRLVTAVGHQDTAGKETANVVNELLGANEANIGVDALTRIAWLLYISAFAGSVYAATLTSQVGADGFEVDEQDALLALETVLEKAIREQFRSTK